MAAPSDMELHGSRSGPCMRTSSRLTNLTPLLSVGAQRQLQPEDMLRLDAQLQPHACGQDMWAEWRKEIAMHPDPPSFLRCLTRLYWRPLLATAALRLVTDALPFVGPLLIKRLVDWLATPLPPWDTHAPCPRMERGLHGSMDMGSMHLAFPEPWQAWWSTCITILKALRPGGRLYGVTLAFAMGAAALARALIGARYNWTMARLQARARAGLQVVLYGKALAAVPHTQHVQSTGDGQQDTQIADVSSLVGVDVGRVLNLFICVHELWSLPLQMVAALALLYIQVRYAFVAGLVVSIALVPINRVISVYIVEASKSMMSAKDERLALTSELIKGLRPIKMMGWEELVTDKIQVSRDREMRYLAVRKYLDAGCVYLWAATSLMFTVLTFGLAAYWGIHLTPGAAATSFALFQVLIMPLNAFPWVINGILEALVSVGRVRQFLRQPEHPRGATCADLVTEQSRPQPNQQSAVRAAGPSSGITNPGSNRDVNSDDDWMAVFDKACFTWTGQLVAPRGGKGSSRDAAAVVETVGNGSHHVGQMCLREVTVAIPRGTSTAITGQVGAGKSSLLAALLAELNPVSGTARVPGTQPPPALLNQTSTGSLPSLPGSPSLPGTAVAAAMGGIAYAPQSPWLFSGSIRDNITLGGVWEEERYQQVLHAAGLLPDLPGLRKGDLTWLGDRGMTLSGGQRARVGLARALYSRCPVLLLDDVLASLDARTAAHVTRALLPGGNVQGNVHGSLLQGRSVVVVTQSVRWLSCAALVVELHQGRVRYCGAPSVYIRDLAHRPKPITAPAPDPISTPSPNPGDGEGLGIAVNGAHGLGGHTAVAGFVPEQAEGGEGPGSDHPVLEDKCVRAGEEASQTTAADYFAVELRAAEGVETGGHGEGTQEEGGESDGPGAEARAAGAVSGAVWCRYMRAVGWGMSLLVLLSLVAMQASKNGADIWVTRWVASGQEDPTNSPPPTLATAQAPASWAWGTHPIHTDVNSPFHFTSTSFTHNSTSTLWPVTSAAMASAYCASRPQSTAVTHTLTLPIQCNSGHSFVHNHMPNVNSNLRPNLSTSPSTAARDSKRSLDPTPQSHPNPSTSMRRKLVAIPHMISSSASVSYFLKGLGIIAGFNAVCTLVRSFSFAYAGMRAGRRNHLMLLGAVTRAPLAFMEGLPAGRVINRFSTDVSRVDDSLPFVLNIFLAQSFSLAGLLIVMMAASPGLMLLLVPLAWIYRRLATYYRASSRELRRLDSIALSPLYQGFAESGEAAPLVRAYGVVGPFLQRHEARAEGHQRASITGSAASIWLSVRLQLLATCLITALGLLATATHVTQAPHQPPPTLNLTATISSPATETASTAWVWIQHVLSQVLRFVADALPWLMEGPADESVDGGLWVGWGSWLVGDGSSSQRGAASLAGLCLAYTLPVVGLLEGLVGIGAETEAEMVSVERCAELCAAPAQPDTLPPHPESGVPADTLPPYPDQGGRYPDMSQTNRHTLHQGRLDPSSRSQRQAGSGSRRKYGNTEGEEGLEQPLLAEGEAQEDGDGKENGWEADGMELGRLRAWAGKHVLELRNVVLRYPGSSSPALAGMCMDVCAGEWVGVVGATGAGKSSLLSALLRLVEIDAGSILLKGRDIRTLPLARLRAHYGVVPQSPCLITGTIRENVDPWRRHDDFIIMRALQAVHLWDVLHAAATLTPISATTQSPARSATTQHPPITTRTSQPARYQPTSASTLAAVLGLRLQGSFSSSPAGGSGPGSGAGPVMSEETALGADAVEVTISDAAPYPSGKGTGSGAAAAVTIGGRVGLSSGQQQLLCLARLLLSGRRVILLDEVTACIDPYTARLVHEVLRTWLRPSLSDQPQAGLDGPNTHYQQQHVTVLQVAHQLESVMDHSRVMVMKEGQVVQSGPPEELLKETGSHFALLAAAAASHSHHH